MYIYIILYLYIYLENVHSKAGHFKHLTMKIEIKIRKMEKLCKMAKMDNN